jgi:predicted HTH transcriptional regulator
LREHGFHINDGTFLDNYKLLTSKGKYNLIADLFADENDISIKIARFEGTTKAKLIERTEYGYKSIILAIRRTLDRFEALNITKSTIKVPQRVDKKLFNIDALREAFINSIAHTKWTEFNPPQIQVFSNRIEIISTGRPIKDLSREDFF